VDRIGELNSQLEELRDTSAKNESVSFIRMKQSAVNTLPDWKN